MARSLRLARRIAGAMSGATSLENPAGSPRLRRVMRVEPSPTVVGVVDTAGDTFGQRDLGFNNTGTRTSGASPLVATDENEWTALGGTNMKSCCHSLR